LLNEAIKDEGEWNDQEEDAQPLQTIHSQKRQLLYIRLDHPSEEQEKREMPDI
jgi:hypothetical protein